MLFVMKYCNWKIKTAIITLFLIGFAFKFEVFSAPPGDKQRVDFVEFYSSSLKGMGVEDLSISSLIENLQKTESLKIKYLIIHLLGEKKIRTAVPYIVPYLNSTDIDIKIAAAEVLGQLGEKRGNVVLEKVCEDNPDGLDCSNAVFALAKNGDELSFKHIKRFLVNKNWAYRNKALLHLKMLAEKIDQTDSTKSKRIIDEMVSSLVNDKDLRVKKSAILYLSGLNVKNKQYIKNKLRTHKNDLSSTQGSKETLREIENAINELEMNDKP